MRNLASSVVQRYIHVNTTSILEAVNQDSFTDLNEIEKISGYKQKYSCKPTVSGVFCVSISTDLSDSIYALSLTVVFLIFFQYGFFLRIKFFLRQDAFVK